MSDSPPVRWGWLLSRVGAIFAGLYGLLLALLFGFQGYLVYPGRLLAGPPPYQKAEVVREIHIPLADGEHLFGYYKPPAPGMATVVSFHGNGGTPQRHATRFQSGPWRDHGWGFLCVGYRGFPGSSGTPDETHLLGDIDAVMAYAHAVSPGTPLLIHGHSLGTAVAVSAASRYSNIGLYLEAPMNSVVAVAAYRFPMFPVSLLMRDTFHSDDRIGGVSSQIFIAHGLRDDIVPIAFGRDLLAHASPSTMFRAADADHASIMGLFDREAEALFRDKLAVAEAFPR